MRQMSPFSPIPSRAHGVTFSRPFSSRIPRELLLLLCYNSEGSSPIDGSRCSGLFLCGRCDCRLSFRGKQPRIHAVKSLTHPTILWV